MKIEITLDDPTKCNGCPCMNQDGEYGEGCNLGFWGGDGDIVLEPEIRPQECIDEHGD